MVSIVDIIWLSQDALEAEVLVTDGVFTLLCFSHPCRLQKNEVLKSPIRAFDPSNVLRLASKSFRVAKLPTPFSYYLEGKLEDKEHGIFKIGEIAIELDPDSLPGDINNEEYISFACDRLDI